MSNKKKLNGRGLLATDPKPPIIFFFFFRRGSNYVTLEINYGKLRRYILIFSYCESLNQGTRPSTSPFKKKIAHRDLLFALGVITRNCNLSVLWYCFSNLEETR